MPSEYAPQAILDLFDAIDRGFGGRAILAGVIGDAAHVYGYHRASAVLPSSDYSKQYGKDQVSGDAAWAACGLDISWERAEDHYTASKRLLNASKANDERLAWLRSWFGSVDGNGVDGWDLAADEPATSDSSHEWHVHLSIHRQAARDYSRLRGIGDVITASSSSGGGGTESEDDMPKRFQAKRIEPLRINQTGVVWDIKWDQQDWDTGNIFYGSNAPTGDQKGAYIATGKPNGASYVSTFNCKVRGLANGQAIYSGLSFYDLDDAERIGGSQWLENISTGGVLEVVDTRVGYSNPGRGIAVRMQTPIAVDIEGAVWSVIHWPQ